ncbi:hypothetical protein [Variovorax sp. EBFNA2]|uniref:hypothetical protein n=1 Tax=Variovorax sp. EBFNA2 TaxID=3342097 RepID=UPI0029C007D3|nr:hypothetical protein [Variovorax boronicumulans]WPG41633.1 hypothetical protein RZE79_32545 [Variovorax boronicumulans]
MLTLAIERLRHGGAISSDMQGCPRNHKISYLKEVEMRNRGRHSPGSPNSELIVLVVIAVLIGTIALLRLAVEREREAGPAQFDLSAWIAGGDLESRQSTVSNWRRE